MATQGVALGYGISAFQAEAAWRRGSSVSGAGFDTAFAWGVRESRESARRSATIRGDELRLTDENKSVVQSAELKCELKRSVIPSAGAAATKTQAMDKPRRGAKRHEKGREETGRHLSRFLWFFVPSCGQKSFVGNARVCTIVVQWVVAMQAKLFEQKVTKTTESSLASFPFVRLCRVAFRVSRFPLHASARPILVLGLLFLFSTAFPGPGLAQSPKYTESVIKVGLLFNFLKLTDWPRESFETDTSPYVLGIYGANPFGNDLNLITRQALRGRPIVTKQCSSVEDAKQCHLVFISPSEISNLRAILEGLKNTHVLTVGETDSFTRLGGTINITIAKKPNFEISKSARERTQLAMKLELLEAGRPVP